MDVSLTTLYSVLQRFETDKTTRQQCKICCSFCYSCRHEAFSTRFKIKQISLFFWRLFLLF